jgi:hypothetical protein
MLVGAHGTRQVFEAFSSDKASNGAFGRGFYFYYINKENFDRVLEEAATFAWKRASGLKKNARVLVCDLDIDNWLNVRDSPGADLWDSWLSRRRNIKTPSGMQKLLEEKGFDSVHNWGRNEIVVYDPLRIKIELIYCLDTSTKSTHPYVLRRCEI